MSVYRGVCLINTPPSSKTRVKVGQDFLDTKNITYFWFRTVAHVDLTEHLVDVVFTLFDDNGDGKLSNK